MSSGRSRGANEDGILSSNMNKQSMQDVKSIIDKVSINSRYGTKSRGGLTIQKNYHSRDNININTRALSNAKEHEKKKIEISNRAIVNNFGLLPTNDFSSPHINLV